MSQYRYDPFDVTGTINVTDANAVARHVVGIYNVLYPDQSPARIERYFYDFSLLFHGQYPGYQACDTPYHDIRHSLDVTVALARTIAGHDGHRPAEDRLGAELFEMGILVALFHDAGYIRTEGDPAASGAVYTSTHISRSADFLKRYLSETGSEDQRAAVERLVHFTGYEVMRSPLEVRMSREHLLGCMIGSADLMSQVSDYDYLEKCRDCLYVELEIAGVTKKLDEAGEVRRVFMSPQHLLRGTANFYPKVMDKLQYQLGGVYNYTSQFFGGKNLYLIAAEDNLRLLKDLIARGQPDILHRTPLRIYRRHEGEGVRLDA